MKILIAGEGGQGIQTIAKILSDIAYQNNFQVVYMPHYGVEMRMGISLAYVQISRQQIVYPKFLIADMIMVLGKRDLNYVKKFVDNNTKIINCIDIDKENTKISKKSINIYCLGLLINKLASCGIIFNKQSAYKSLITVLTSKSGIDKNIEAFNLGLADNQINYIQSLDNIKETVYNPIITTDNTKSHIRFPNLCKSCGICIISCPTKALFWSKDYANFINQPMPDVIINKCIACGICEKNCPDCAISVVKK